MNHKYYTHLHFFHRPYLCCFLVFHLTACAGPQPVLFPNAHYKEVSPDQVEQDIAECRDMADKHVSSGQTEKVAGRTAVGAGIGAASGAVGGAVTGAPGIGTAIGAAAGATMWLLTGFFKGSPPNRTYMNFVNKCLEERGYEPTGWK